MAASEWEFMTPPDADHPRLEKLRVFGQKLILYHGQSDAVFAIDASARWIEKLHDNVADADDSARLFAAPGMNIAARDRRLTISTCYRRLLAGPSREKRPTL